MRKFFEKCGAVVSCWLFVGVFVLTGVAVAFIPAYYSRAAGEPQQFLSISCGDEIYYLYNGSESEYREGNNFYIPIIDNIILSSFCENIWGEITEPIKITLLSSDDDTELNIGRGDNFTFDFNGFEIKRILLTGGKVIDSSARQTGKAGLGNFTRCVIKGGTFEWSDFSYDYNSGQSYLSGGNFGEVFVRYDNWYYESGRANLYIDARVRFTKLEVMYKTGNSNVSYVTVTNSSLADYPDCITYDDSKVKPVFDDEENLIGFDSLVEEEIEDEEDEEDETPVDSVAGTQEPGAPTPDKPGTEHLENQKEFPLVPVVFGAVAGVLGLAAVVSTGMTVSAKRHKRI